MIKRVLLWVMVVVVALAVLAIGYVLSIKVDRPSESVDPASVLHNDRYKRSADRAEDWLESVYQRHLLPSFSVSVGVEGALVWEGVAGYSDLSSATLADQHTKYRIGSVSKPITATAVLRMQENGIISIDSRFEDYVKGYPQENSGFTVKQLMTHQGGVRHYNDPLSENFSTKEYISRRDAASIVKNDALLFSPGEGFHYSTYGYTLLALVLEEVSSSTFESVMHKEVFNPARMVSTEFDKADLKEKKSVAQPYLHVGESLYESPEVNLSYKYAGGGYLSTPSDLVRFANALLDDTLLTESSKELMWTPVALDNGAMNPENYALGFRVGKDEVGRFVHHGGKSVGGYAFLLIYPEKRVVVAFASNVTPSGDTIDRLEEAKTVARMFLEEM